MKLLSIPSILLTLIAAATPALAHDLYLMPEKFVTQAGTLLRLVFQNGDEFPVGVSAVKPERLRNTRLLSKAGSVDFENITEEAKRTVATVRVPGGGLAILTASLFPISLSSIPQNSSPTLRTKISTKWSPGGRRMANPASRAASVTASTSSRWCWPLSPTPFIKNGQG